MFVSLLGTGLGTVTTRRTRLVGIMRCPDPMLRLRRVGSRPGCFGLFDIELLSRIRQSRALGSPLSIVADSV